MEKREHSYIVGGNVYWYSSYGEQYGGSLKQLKNGPEVFVQPLFPHWNRLAPTTLSSRTSDLHCGCQLCTLLKMPTVEGMISKGLFAVTPRVGIWVEHRWPILQLADFSIWLCRHHTEKWYDMLWWSCSSLFYLFSNLSLPFIRPLHCLFLLALAQFFEFPFFIWGIRISDESP